MNLYNNVLHNRVLLEGAPSDCVMTLSSIILSQHNIIFSLQKVPAPRCYCSIDKSLQGHRSPRTPEDKLNLRWKPVISSHHGGNNVCATSLRQNGKCFKNKIVPRMLDKPHYFEIISTLKPKEYEKITPSSRPTCH